MHCVRKDMNRERRATSDEAFLKALEDVQGGRAKKLQLSGMELGDARVRELAEALKENQTMTQIDLSINEIGDEGVGALAEALQVNQSWRQVDLALNHIGVDGARALA